MCESPKKSYYFNRVVEISEFIVNNSSITHSLLTPIRLTAIQLNPVTVPISFMIQYCAVSLPPQELGNVQRMFELLILSMLSAACYDYNLMAFTELAFKMLYSDLRTNIM